MRTKIVPFLTVSASALVSIVFAACSGQGAVTATPAGVAAAATSAVGCTPTPAVRAPTFTVAPNERATPGAFNTALARYQATYPGDFLVPTQTTDLAPQVAVNDKEIFFVKHSNCTYERVLLTADQVEAFKRNLPTGDTIVAQAPPPSSVGNRPFGMTPTPNGTPGGSIVPSGSIPPVPPPPPAALRTAVVRDAQTAVSGTPAKP